MTQNRLVIGIAFTFALVGCKSLNSREASDIQSTPVAGGAAVPQGGTVVENLCNKGGHKGPTTGKGWVFSYREGCFLDCSSKEAIEQDFLDQLKAHRVYGDPAYLAAKDPEGARVATFYQSRLQKLGLKANSFARLTRKDVFDGSNWQGVGIEPGDIFLNMNFGQPNHAGIFYAKRGIAHARLVVDVKGGVITTFDGGWKQFSQMKQVGSQIVWLRPRTQFLKPGDKENIVKWAKTLEPDEYDNTLVDDWKEYRSYLNSQLDQGINQFVARDKAMSFARDKHIAPFGFDESFTFRAPSGLYCSEGAAAIYSYLGFRMQGENIIDQLTAYSTDGSVPDWNIYEDALSGFGADSDKNIYMMHKLFYNYFQIFDLGRKKGLFTVPGLKSSQAATFSEAAKANLKAVEADGGANDHMAQQLAQLESALAQDGKEAAQLEAVRQLRAGLNDAVAALSQKSQTTMNLSQALYTMFYSNMVYGPHSFFENGKYFELKGVFYNTDLKGKGQALYIADWWMSTVGKASLSANISTTLYRVSEKGTAPAGRCVVGEPAPVMETE